MPLLVDLLGVVAHTRGLLGCTSGPRTLQTNPPSSDQLVQTLFLHAIVAMPTPKLKTSDFIEYTPSIAYSGAMSKATFSYLVRIRIVLSYLCNSNNVKIREDVLLNFNQSSLNLTYHMPQQQNLNVFNFKCYTMIVEAKDISKIEIVTITTTITIFLSFRVTDFFT
ncbi:hypothetical protein Leryth_023351 [Lithospermum erythrorhizon]|nr:hypothetical protein Leryth_023351 [Lithospermum erythrorhizon]